jgi:uncharacterized protein YggE
LAALVVGVSALLLSTSPTARAQASPEATIVATGNATESRSPDQAAVSLGVQAVGKTSAEAQDALNKAMEKVIRAVKDTQLAQLVVQTQGLSLQPEYEDNGSRSRPPRISGYRASNTINARTADVDKIGKLVDAGVAAGANQVWGISFSLKDSAAARHDAMVKATADARARAGAIAEGLGVRLGRVVHASSGNAQVRPFASRFSDGGFASASAGVSSAVPTPVEAGEVNVTADVTVEFAIEAPK